MSKKNWRSHIIVLEVAIPPGTVIRKDHTEKEILRRVGKNIPYGKSTLHVRMISQRAMNERFTRAHERYRQRVEADRRAKPFILRANPGDR